MCVCVCVCGGGGGGGGSDFYHKKEGIGKIEGCFKKGGITFFILNNLFQCYLSLSIFCACLCVFCLFYLFMAFLSEFILFHGKNLVLLNQISRYWTSTS